MRFLKVFTTAVFLVGLLALASWPWFVGPRPEAGQPRALQMYGMRMLILFAVSAGSFVGAAFGAWLIMRRQRAEYSKGLTKNIRDLIEGSLDDHAKPQP